MSESNAARISPSEEVKVECVPVDGGVGADEVDRVENAASPFACNQVNLAKSERGVDGIS